MAHHVGDVQAGLDAIADRWRGDRRERLGRRHLERADFDDLRDAGFLRMVVPADRGGTWEGAPGSTRSIAGALRSLGAADPSPALVAAMHPAVLGYWLMSPDPDQPRWEEQRQAVFDTALDGRQWGTITSEPGSGGDISRTRATAEPASDLDPGLPGDAYRITGDKHFGSGSGICHLMITTALPSGTDAPALFAIDVADLPWERGDGMALIAEWDGMGMAATQSHAMRLEGMPATRATWGGPLDDLSVSAAPFVSCLFTAVVMGVLDEAVALARRQVADRGASLRAYEQTEWTRAELDHWLAAQAFEGALRAVESGDRKVALHAALRAKQGIAELGEQCLTRLGRVLGGGTFSQRSPFAHWFEDVRALGFLRPPWGLAYDSLFVTSLDGG